MKYQEINDANVRKAKMDYIDSRWGGLHRLVSSSLERVVNYLFVLNTGGLLATLTYIATKPDVGCLRLSIWCFVGGVVLILIHAAVDYYSTEKLFSSFRSAVNAFYKSELNWDDMIANDKRSSWLDGVLHVLGWLSGVLFLTGLCIGISSI